MAMHLPSLVSFFTARATRRCYCHQKHAPSTLLSCRTWCNELLDLDAAAAEVSDLQKHCRFSSTRPSPLLSCPASSSHYQ